ncbi:phosphate acetyltransferase [Salmonella enterica subsp. enterica serovar Cerro str. FSL R8-0235]|nr:phosphate acetyltransferase [Salmonella enterica subsp. enterica serovar Cerro str. FSL R8-0235]
MSRIIMLIPTGTSVGLTSVSLGVIRAMERKGVRLSVFKPIAQPRAGGDAPDQTTTIVRANSVHTTRTTSTHTRSFARTLPCRRLNR